MLDTPRTQEKDDIKSALAEQETAYAQTTPLSREAFNKACEAMPGGVTRSNLYFPPHPPSIERAAGSRLTDIDGNDYIDFISDFTVAVHGHGHDAIGKTVQRTIENGYSFGGRIEAETDLANELKKRFPSIDLIRFTNSGTESDLYAMLLARSFTGRNKILVCEGAYLGGAFTFASAKAPLNAPIETVIVPYNDVKKLTEAFDQHENEIAAVAIELMLNSGGCISATQEFANACRDLSKKAGALLIVDEVMTSRLDYHGLQGVYGLTPDLTTFGKMIGGGFPTGAFGGRADIMAAFDGRRGGASHNGSFNNNVFTMNAGVTALREILTPEALSDMNQKGDALRHSLNDIIKNRDLPLIFTGAGSAMAMHHATSEPTHYWNSPSVGQIRALLHIFMVNKGYWIARRAMVSTSLENTQSDIDGFLAAFSEFCERYGAIIKAQPI